jgi:hypothetical protein
MKETWQCLFWQACKLPCGVQGKGGPFVKKVTIRKGSDPDTGNRTYLVVLHTVQTRKFGGRKRKDEDNDEDELLVIDDKQGGLLPKTPPAACPKQPRKGIIGNIAEEVQTHVAGTMESHVAATCSRLSIICRLAVAAVLQV